MYIFILKDLLLRQMCYLIIVCALVQPVFICSFRLCRISKKINVSVYSISYLKIRKSKDYKKRTTVKKLTGAYRSACKDAPGI